MSDIYLLDIILWIVVIASAWIVASSNSLLRSLVFMALLSLCSALLYLSWHAPDVAITEAAIGAAVSTIFTLVAIEKIGWKVSQPARNKAAAIAVAIMITIAMFAIAPDMPVFGSFGNTLTDGSSAHYLHKSYGETEIPNIVTSVLASYRGYDTLGELNVILAAALAVMLIMPAARSAKNEK